MLKKRVHLLPWLVCGLGALFYCYEYCLRILPSVMAEDLMKEFSVSGAAFGHLVAFYYYAYTPMQLPVGVMMDRFGPRKLLVFASLLCAVGTHLFSHHYLPTAQFGRFLVGFGSAFAFVGVLKLASLWFLPSRFALITGMATSLGMVGAMIGDILLSELVVSLGPTTTLYVSALLGLALAVMIWYVIPEKTRGAGGSAEVAAVSDAVELNYREFFAAVWALCRNSQMWLVGVIGSCLYLSLAGFGEIWGIPYLIRVYGLSGVSAAAAVSFVFLGWAIGSPLVGWLSDKVGNRRYPIVGGALLGALLFSLIIYCPSTASPYLKILLFAFGVCSSAQIIVFPIARELNLPSLAGTAVAVTNLLVMLGGAISQPLIGKILDIRTGVHVNGHLEVFSVESFQHALSIIPFAFVSAAVLAFFVRETRNVVGPAPLKGVQGTSSETSISGVNVCELP